MKIEYNKEYSFEEVKEAIREKQIHILDEVVKICERHNLTYWLDGGTLLGAVRHKGFIPWDDDIDIGMMRDDYEKFLKIIQKELPDDLVLQSRQTDVKYYNTFIKIRDKYTEIKANSFEDNHIYRGIFIDIFPFDRIPKSNFLKNIQSGISQIFTVATSHPNVFNTTRKRNLRSKIITFFIYMFYFLGKLLNTKSELFIRRNIMKLSKLSPSDDVGDGIVTPFIYFRSIRRIDVYLPVRQGEFNNKLYNIPNNTHEYLKTLYGLDYMTPINMNNIHVDKVIFMNIK